MSTSTNANDTFSVEDADIELVALKEYETSNFMIGTTELRPDELTFASVHYEEVFDKLRSAITSAVKHCQETLGKRQVNVRVTHRQKQMIEPVEDRYIGVFSICAYEKPEEVINPSKMDFGRALNELKQGKKIARSGWNGKGMWLKLIGFSAQTSYDILGDKEIHALDALLPWIGMKTADNCFVPWLASQTDILVNDWVVVS